MGKQHLGMNVFDAAVDRLTRLFEDGHRVVVTLSGGKDSGACLELALIAKQLAGVNAPLDVVTRDEEAMFPGTYEYIERVANRPEVSMHWLYACQPIINVFNRQQPYWWVFDPELPREKWVRQPPDFAERIPELEIDSIVTPQRFPPAEGKGLFAVMGLRADESLGRLLGVHSSGGYLTTRPNKHGVLHCRPIYDWRDGDIWKAHREFGWDYNSAYDQMHRLGVSRSSLRIAPPTMNIYGTPLLPKAMTAWPKWFDRLSERCPGVRTAAQYGVRSVTPQRRLDETWEECYERLCVQEAPEWIRHRAVRIREIILRLHRKHSTAPFPDVKPCRGCGMVKIASWKRLARAMYNGDPFCSEQSALKMVDPDFFRPGSGFWTGGDAAW